MNVKQIRVANLKQLIDARADGNQRQFAEECGLNKAHVSQMVTGYRDMGDKVARKIETKCGLSPGQMDVAWDENGVILTAEAHRVAADWLLISEPLKSQMSHAIHSAAEVARKYGPLAAHEHVAEYIKAAPTTRERGTEKKKN